MKCAHCEREEKPLIAYGLCQFCYWHISGRLLRKYNREFKKWSAEKVQEWLSSKG